VVVTSKTRRGLVGKERGGGSFLGRRGDRKADTGFFVHEETGKPRSTRDLLRIRVKEKRDVRCG